MKANKFTKKMFEFVSNELFILVYKEVHSFFNICLNLSTAATGLCLHSQFYLFIYFKKKNLYIYIY
jgi:hypothetical protein